MSHRVDAAKLRDLQSVTDAGLAYLPLENLLAELLTRLVDILEVDTAAILLLEDDGRTLVARAARGLEEEVERGVRVPVRQGRRNEQIDNVLAPLKGRMSKKDLDRIAHALGLVVGTEAMIALTDAVGLDVPAAKRTLLDAGRWLLAGALGELNDSNVPS